MSAAPHAYSAGMPLVMVDTNFSLRATIPRPGGLARKAWVLFAFGAAQLRAEQLELDFAELNGEAARSGGRLSRSESLFTASAAELARLEELLPIGTPTDWALAGSQACWDEYQRKALELASRLHRSITPRQAGLLRQQYEALCVVAPKPSYALQVPALTPDPDDDLLVFDAMRVGADIFVSDDPHVIPADADGAIDYEFGELSVRAMTPGYFFDQIGNEVDWDSIDGSWIRPST